MKLSHSIQSFQYLLSYLLKARHRSGHGIHSPFVFDFVTRVLFNQFDFSEYKNLQSIRTRLENSKEVLEINEIGAGSRQFKGSARAVKQMVRQSSVKAKYAKLLFRIAYYYKPSLTLELGTSLGLSSLCFAWGNPKGKVVSIEGNLSLCNFATKLIQDQGIENTEIIHALFDDALPSLQKSHPCPKLVYIDGNHDYQPTLAYFDHFATQMNSGILLFDDINWSKNMRRAWKEIKTDPRAIVSIDLFQMGIVFLDDSITPGHYNILF